LYFLIGADSFFSLRYWHRAAEIPFCAQLIVASRPGEQLSDLARGLPDGIELEETPIFDSIANGVRLEQFSLHNSKGQSAPLYLLPELNYDVSASHIRGEWRGGEIKQDALLSSVPKPVADYIRVHHLYGSLAPTDTSD
jgi:nicotinic acid mononucleotide adenylyltransferase